MGSRTLLDAAAELLRRVLCFDAAADGVVAAFFREHHELGARDRRRLGETVYRVLRERRLIEHLATGFGEAPLERRLAMVAESAELASIDRSGLPDALRHNLPDWLADALRAQLGDEEFWLLVESLQAPAPLDLRVNVLKARREPVRAALREQGIDASLSKYSPWGLRVAGKPPLGELSLMARGKIEVQDEGSQLIALLVDARRGQTVVDFCAGAGGKTLALGAAMRNSGRLYAFDASAHRLDQLKPRLRRSGLTNVHAMRIDDEHDERLQRLAGKVARVLVDAPCSGLGTLRRNPDLKWRQTPATVSELQAQQRSILAAAAALLEPGGRLVYATCSLLAEENESVARAFTESHPQFVPLPALQALEQVRVADAASLVRGAYLRLWPHRHGTDAFFAALWRFR